MKGKAKRGAPRLQEEQVKVLGMQFSPPSFNDGGEKVVKDPPVDHGFTCSCTYCKTYAPRLQSHDPRAYRYRGVQPDRTCHWSDKYWADYPRSRDRVGLTNGEWGLRIGELQRVADRILDDLIESLQSLREERA